jgi:hypothetical protein
MLSISYIQFFNQIPLFSNLIGIIPNFLVTFTEQKLSIYVNRNKEGLMKSNYSKIFISTFLVFVIAPFFLYGMSKKAPVSQPDTTIKTREAPQDGLRLVIDFRWGAAFNHPTFAVWIEELDGSFIETLYATESISTGTWPYGEVEPGKWKPEPGNQVRPAALPYWLHKRSKNDQKPNLPTPEDPLPDAITSATPKSNFRLKTGVGPDVPKKFRLLVEINQTWDWNNYWTNNKFPEDKNYKTSAQPAVVYAVNIDLTDKITEYYLNPVGHSHYSGKNGLLYTDLSTLTTAMNIVEAIKLEINR